MKNSSLLTYRGLSLSFCHLFGLVLLFSCPKIMSLTEPQRYFVHSHIRTRKERRIFRHVVKHGLDLFVKPGLDSKFVKHGLTQTYS